MERFFRRPNLENHSGTNGGIPLERLHWKPAPLLYPVPVVLVSCGGMESKHNLLTVAWAGTINSKPPMVGIAIKPERFSYQLIQASGDFVVNIPPKRLIRAVDFCGVRSGAQIDKFQEAGLTPEPSHKVTAVRVKECPVALECKVKQVIPLGSHHYFIAEVVGVELEERLLDATGRLDFERVDPLVYVHGRYHGIKPGEGFFGFSVARKSVKKRRRS